MTTLKAVLVDDEASSLRTLKFELETYCDNIEIMEIYQDPVKAVTGIESLQPDVVFLDIEMPVLNGFDVLKSFNQINFDVIFVTAYDEFAIRAFDFNAVDYLLKPVLKTKLIQSVKKIAERKQHSFDQKQLNALMQNINRSQEKPSLESIAIPTQEGFELVHVDEIMYLLAESNYTWVYLVNDQKYLVSKTLKEVSGMINRDHYFRSHKSYFVNLNYVRKYVRGRGGYLVLKNNLHIPVSRNQRSELMEVLGL